MFFPVVGKRKPRPEMMQGGSDSDPPTTNARSKRSNLQGPAPLPLDLPVPAGYELPMGWNIQLDTKTQRYYFWNSVTHETTWDPPPAPVSSSNVSHIHNYNKAIGVSTRGAGHQQVQPLSYSNHQNYSLGHHLQQQQETFHQLHTQIHEAQSRGMAGISGLQPGSTSPLSSPRTRKKLGKTNQSDVPVTQQQKFAQPPTTSPVLKSMPGVPQRSTAAAMLPPGEELPGSATADARVQQSQLGSLPGMPPIPYCDSPQITQNQKRLTATKLHNDQVTNIKRGHQRTLSNGPPIVSWPNDNDFKQQTNSSKQMGQELPVSASAQPPMSATVLLQAPTVPLSVSTSTTPTEDMRSATGAITSPLSSARKMLAGASVSGGTEGSKPKNKNDKWDESLPGNGNNNMLYSTKPSSLEGSLRTSSLEVIPPPENVSPITRSREYSGNPDRTSGFNRSFSNRKRRENVVAESLERSPEDGLQNLYPKPPEVVEMIKNVLQKHYLFQQTNSEDLEDLVNAMKEIHFKPAEAVVTLGETGDYFYVIGTGEFEVQVPGSNPHRISQGCFGEFALLYGQPRAATIVAVSDASAFALDRHTFRKWRESATTTHLVEAKAALRNVPLLSVLTDAQLDLIKDLVQFSEFQAGTEIIKKGEIGVTFYIIRSGKVQCTGGEAMGSDDNVLELGANDFFGERALLTDEPRAANVVALTKVSAMVLDRVAFKKILGPLRELLDYNVRATVLNQLPLFCSLSDAERKQVFRAFTTQQFAPKQAIIRQGDFGAEFFIMRFGEARVIQESNLDNGRVHTHEVGRLSTGNHFGEMALLESGRPRVASVVAITDCECFVLERQKFEELLGPAKEILSRAADQRKLENQIKTKNLAVSLSPDSAQNRRVRHHRSSSQERNMSCMTNYKLMDLKTIRTLGTGTFGRVRLVLHEPTGNTYALKIQSKKQIVERKTQANVLNEKWIMLQLSSPFIIQLHQTFNDRDCLYMLLELVPGGELFSLLQTQGQYLTTEHQIFYTSCVLAALETMHERSILYRDLKPENLLIDREGYIKICDFGFAKVVVERTFTLCGTPEYFSPELVLGNGYGKGNDYWTIGILVYEIMNGYTPFGVPEAPQGEICRRIVTERLLFPNDCDDEYGMDLIVQLLQKKVVRRLGCGREGVYGIRRHPWFSNIDFDMLKNRRYAAPWVPDLRNNLETRFDTYDEHFVPDAYTDDGSGWDNGF